MSDTDQSGEQDTVNVRRQDWKMPQKDIMALSSVKGNDRPGMLEYLDKLLVDKQFDTVLSHIKVFRETEINGSTYPDSANTSFTLRELEARLMLGRTEKDLKRIHPSDDDEGSRWRILRLFEHLVDERYKDIVDEYDRFGETVEISGIHRSAYDLCLWLLDERQAAPEITQSSAWVGDFSPIADSLVTYLILVTTRVLHDRRLNPNAPDPLALDLFSKLEVPTGVDVVLGEYWDVQGLIDPAKFLAIHGTAVHNGALTYSEACIRARAAMLHLADGNIAIATAITSSLAGTPAYTTSLHSRVLIANFLIGLEMGTSENSVNNLRKMHDPDNPGLRSLYSDDVRTIVALLRITVTPKTELDWLSVLVYLLACPRLTPTNVVPAVLERCCDGLDMLMNHGMMLEAAQLMEAIDYRIALDGGTFPSEALGRLVVLSEMWALCSRKRSPLSLAKIPSNHPQSARGLLNQAHVLYGMGDTNGAHAIAVELDIFDPSESPLDWHRHALIRAITAPWASSSQHSSVPNLDLSSLTPQVAASLLPLFLNWTRILAQACEWGPARDILTVLVGKLTSTTEIHQCNFYLAECYEATGNHWKAAKLFGELSKQEFLHPLVDGSIDGLASYRLAKNLFLDFKHQLALTHLQRLLTTTQPYSEVAILNRLKIMRMICVCHEALDALPAARRAWGDLLSLLSDRPENRTEYANALNRIAVLTFRTGDYKSAGDAFSKVHVMYQELFGPHDGRSKEALLHMGMCEFHLSGEASLGATFAHAAVSSDVQLQEHRVR